jgi:hypothetical protein
LSEIWKPTPSPNYEVSNFGRVRRATCGHGTCVGRILKPKLKNSGYLFVCFSDDGVLSYWHVHLLVAQVFIGPRPEGMQINHKNLDKTNNRDGNLEYVTPVQNCAHAAVHGHTPSPENIPHGEKHYDARLTEADVIEARDLYATGVHSCSALSRRFKVTPRAIWKAVTGKSWKHLPAA